MGKGSRDYLGMYYPNSGDSNGKDRRQRHGDYWGYYIKCMQSLSQAGISNRYGGKVWSMVITLSKGCVQE